MASLASPLSPRQQPSPTAYRPIKTFNPLPWQIEPWHDTSPVLLLTGSAGGGKSRLAAEKVHAFCLRYPGCTALVLRKSRASLNKSVLLQLREIMGNDPRVKHVPSQHRFDYYNGSVLVYGGMKDESQRESIRSVGPKGGVDIAWMEEATQFIEADYNELSARMRGRAAPWSQVILTTNPDGPAHWINVRLILGGEASVRYSKAQDNIHNPGDYATKKLGRLSGVEKKRLAEGQWVAGSGQIFDTYLDDFNAATGKDYGGNVTLQAEYQEGAGPVVWAIDDGYAGRLDDNTRMFTGRSHPRAILFFQKRYDGKLALFGESYKIQTLATDHVRQVKAESAERGWPLPDYVVQDRAAAALVGVLEAEGLDPIFNKVPVDESIKVMREWLAPDHNQVRRLLVHPRCFYFRYQMQTYSYDEAGNVIKEHDDGADATRYLLWQEDFCDTGGIDVATWSDIR